MKKIFHLFLVIAVLFALSLVSVVADDNITDTNSTIDINCSLTNGSIEINGTLINCSDYYVVEDNSTTLNNTDANITINTTVDSDNVANIFVEDIRAFETENGAKMRLLQLEKSLTRQISYAEQIIVVVVDSSDLEEIYDELVILREDVVNEREHVLVVAATSTLSFVELKHSAIELSKSFRDLLKEIMPANERAALKNSLKIHDFVQEELDDLDEEIEEERNAHNADRLDALFVRFGVTDEDLMSRVRNGSASVGDVQKSLHNNYKKLSEKAKIMATKKFNEHKVKSNVFEYMSEDKVKDDLEQKLQERKEKWSNNSKVLKEKFERKSLDGNKPDFAGMTGRVVGGRR